MNEYIPLIKLNAEQSLWVTSSVTQRGKQKGCWGTMLETLKLFLLQPLLSSTKWSWRPVTVGCIRWCLFQGAQKKMGDGIVDIKVFSAALFVTAVMLISHYQSTDCAPSRRYKAFQGIHKWLHWQHTHSLC